MTSLTGKVIAIVGTGSARDRVIAVSLAEAGADIAIATEEALPAQEFATASIANEVWAIGREQFSAVLDASDGAAVAAFLREVRHRLGRLDAVVGPAPIAARIPEERSDGVAPVARIALVGEGQVAPEGTLPVLVEGMDDAGVAAAVAGLLLA